MLTGLVPAEIGNLTNLTAPFCELTSPSFEMALNKFDPPVSPAVKEKCFVMTKDEAVLHNVHWPCGMCMHHRCSLWGHNKCAYRKGYSDPQGEQTLLCACACCGQQCARGPCNTTNATDLKSLPPADFFEEEADARMSPMVAAAGVLAVVALAAAVAVPRH